VLVEDLSGSLRVSPVEGRELRAMGRRIREEAGSKRLIRIAHFEELLPELRLRPGGFLRRLRLSAKGEWNQGQDQEGTHTAVGTAWQRHFENLLSGAYPGSAKAKKRYTSRRWAT
jgi:hypothetical protein